MSMITPENVFRCLLRMLSMFPFQLLVGAHVMGYPTFRITPANFDLVDLGDYRKKIGYDDPNYYYRPRKNIVNRPTCRGGMGWHFTGDHQVTIPTLYDKLKEAGF